MSDQGRYSQVYMGSNGEFSSDDQVFSKGGGGPFSSSTPTNFHGADIRLSKNASGCVSRLTSGGRHSTPTVRSYSDGIRVGCSFVTNEAIELIYSWHQEFLKNGNSKVHQ